jgi:hypothetical protein
VKVSKHTSTKRRQRKEWYQLNIYCLLRRCANPISLTLWKHKSMSLKMELMKILVQLFILHIIYTHIHTYTLTFTYTEEEANRGLVMSGNPDELFNQLKEQLKGTPVFKSFIEMLQKLLLVRRGGKQGYSLLLHLHRSIEFEFEFEFRDRDRDYFEYCWFCYWLNSAILWSLIDRFVQNAATMTKDSVNKTESNKLKVKMKVHTLWRLSQRILTYY